MVLNLEAFFKEKGIGVVNGVIKYKDWRKRGRWPEDKPIELLRGSNQILYDMIDVLSTLQRNHFEIRSLDNPVLRDIIIEVLGCSRSHAYKVATAIVVICLGFY